MTILVIIYGLVALTSGAFIAIYAPRKWWTHPTGHSIMATKVAIFLMSLAVILRSLEVPGAWILLGAAGAHMALVLTLRVILLLTIQKPSERQSKRSAPSNSKAD